MKHSPLLVLESAAFSIIPGEDEQTNPGIVGKSLALWLAEQLRVAGFSAGDIIAEDFGWCIPVDATSQSLYIACAGTEEEPDQWRVFAFAESRVIDRLRGKDPGGESLATLFAAVRRCIEAAP